MTEATQDAGAPRALIVDDSKTIRLILRDMLENLGYVVQEAEDGRAALAWLEAHGAVDLALVDWEMPEMDGITFVRSVRREDAYRDMRIVMVTKETRLDNVTEALGAGADEYIMKPFTEDVVREKLEIIGGMRRA